MDWRRDLQGSLSTLRFTIAKSCAVHTKNEEATSGPSVLRVGSFHVTARRATAVPTLELIVGANP